ncbi:hypothetical protein [Mucilaginibacter sp. UR6-11]|uniref:hypothetical protein n=1 Tax=Mucilaginibacter sp. UR6-11 TaxID=1435644 RepID=UPI001E61279C|nr:hypothetical protein [Mucilaginibacter sp. UR6-11]MCC8424529.1 hypothetical protein [Mucilaginibacter sp. UR6-11]
MKHSLKYTLILLIAVACFYITCKKDATLSDNTINAGDLSKQIAISLYKSLSGQYGGANINDGIKAPLNIAPGHKGPRINNVNPYCGLVIDTSYQFQDVIADTVKRYFGHYKFTYVCTGDVLDSYRLDDSIANTVTYPLYTANYKLTQKYFVKAIDQTHKISSVEGTIGFSSHASLASATHGTTQYHNNDSHYVLQGVKVDISSGTADVVEGTAAFTAQIANLDGNTAVNNNFNGTITFSGHLIARVLIHLGNETKLYVVNMITGEVTTG